MMNKNDQEFLVQKIRTEYTEKEHTQLDALKELDAKVRRPANVFAYIFGGISAIVMGSGMSLVMTDIGETLGMASPMAPGIAIGIVGLLMAVVNYPVYNRILRSRKNRYAAEVLALSEKIMNE
ncbi:MAG: dihydropteridine reductase [Emergencia sp.]